MYDFEFKKDMLISLLKNSGLPMHILNSASMSWKKIDIEKIAEYLLNNGVDIINPYRKEFDKIFGCRYEEVYGKETTTNGKTKWFGVFTGKHIY